MAKLLLINPSYLRTYGTNQRSIANPVYPILSLAVLAGEARKSGHQVHLLDLSYREYDPDYIKNVIFIEKPDVIGITATTPLVNQMYDISFLVKDISKNIMTIGGGSHPSSLPLETMKESVLDLVAFGEADYTIVDILDGKKNKNIDGIYYRDGEHIIANPPRALVDNLDELSMPAWEIYPIEEYKDRLSRLLTRYPPVSTIEFSRGCVFQCDFCASKNTMGYGYRKKSPERCAEEMLYLQKLGYREVCLTDDIFTTDNNWAIDVCETFIKKGVKIKWTCTNGIRVDNSNSKLFEVMKLAGCYRVHFGFESGNNDVLKAFGKGGKATLAQGIDAVNSARKAGLETCGMYLLGLMSDTVETMQDTLDYAKSTKVDLMRIGITVPLPGTRMFHELRQQNRIKTFDWDEYSIYNQASAIFDHPNLEWETIMSFFRKGYDNFYLKNPKYVLRRIWLGMKTGEFFWDVYYLVKFIFKWRKVPDQPDEENYAYRGTWEKLNIGSREEIRWQEPQKVRKLTPS